MNINIKTLLVAATALGVAACSDEWDNHYDNDSGRIVTDAPTLMEQIAADGDLANFARVLRHTGYDRVLASPQALTVWAPVISQQQADSVCALYDNQKVVLGRRDQDNTAITQFVQNHIALFNRSVPENYNDSIRMLNGKYVILTGSSIGGVEFLKKNSLASNGILFKLPHTQTFYPNVREGLAILPELDSVAAYYDTFDRYELNESQSVQMGIVDGKIVYADSVFDISNRLYNNLGWVAREDSSYLFLAPTNEVWRREYAQYMPLFTYVNNLANRDSVARLNAQFSIIRGRVFNLNQQKNDYNDSIFNTAYRRMTGYYGLNVYQQPKAAGGILAGLTPWQCSNGQILTDPEGRIDPATTFKQVRYISASSPMYRSMPLVKVSEENLPMSTVTTRSVPDTITFEGLEIKDNNFIEVEPISYGSGVAGGNRNSTIYFYLPSTFSSVFYNIYVVMMPAYASGLVSRTDASNVPTRFQVYHAARRATPRTSSSSTSPNDDLEFDYTNDASDGSSALSVPAGETHGSGRYFETTGNTADVICIAKGLEAKLSCYNAFGDVDPIHRFRLTTDVRPSALSRGEMTNIMRINRIIYIPFETKEEAEAYQLDMSNLKEFKE